MVTSVTNRVNTFLLVLVSLMAAAIIAILANRASAGPLDPPAPPASTGHNLIFEPSSCSGFPIVLSQPGSYALASNITLPGGCTFKDAIDINASNVTLDLGGFAVIGLATNSGSGIVAGSSTANLRLTNGIVNTWSGDAVDFTNATNSALDHINASGGSSASSIGIGATTTLTDCVTSGGYNGVVVTGNDSTVQGCSISGAGNDGVDVLANASTVKGSELANNPTGVSVGSSDSGVLMVGNHVTGSHLAFGILGNENVVEENVANNGVGLGPEIVNVTGLDNIVYRNTADGSTNGITASPSTDAPNSPTMINAKDPSAGPWANIGN